MFREPVLRSVVSLVCTLLLLFSVAATSFAGSPPSSGPGLATLEALDNEHKAMWARFRAEARREMASHKPSSRDQVSVQDTGDIRIVGPYFYGGTGKTLDESRSGVYDVIKWTGLYVLGQFYATVATLVDFTVTVWQVAVNTQSSSTGASYRSYAYFYVDGQYQSSNGSWVTGVKVEKREVHRSGWSSYWGTNGVEYSAWYNNGVSKYLRHEQGCHYTDYAWISEMTYHTYLNPGLFFGEAYYGCTWWNP